MKTSVLMDVAIDRRRRPKQAQWCPRRPSTFNVYLKKNVFLNSEKMKKKIIFQNFEFSRYFWHKNLLKTQNFEIFFFIISEFKNTFFYKCRTSMVDVDATELFMVDVDQTEVFHWLTVDIWRRPSTLSMLLTSIITDVFITPEFLLPVFNIFVDFLCFPMIIYSKTWKNALKKQCFSYSVLQPAFRCA